MGRTDIRPAEEYLRKSVGTESTFKDMSTKIELREKLRHTAEELEKDLLRAGFKGRTLVLKIKLHTYEVFTRQAAPPKAVHTAEDLYNYALPMLAKLEKEIPNMKLRLMGLRCTNLISTRKESDNFFGPAARQLPLPGDSLDDNGWEVFPDAEFEQSARMERQDEMDELARLDGQQVENASSELSNIDFHEPFGRYKTNHFPNPTTAPRRPLAAAEQRMDIWSCPICSLPQPTNDNDAFNAHIDFCLSRRTIKEAVGTDSVECIDGEKTYAISSREKRGKQQRPGKRKASAMAHAAKSTLIADRKQKRLFFA